jgi:hypothetical protein
MQISIKILHEEEWVLAGKKERATDAVGCKTN